ncbi:MAG: hypothetical protein IPM29_25585 [Planctomycetes bacterium]|nr:hypothetical protein [Planctomycetota bacterium]
MARRNLALAALLAAALFGAVRLARPAGAGDPPEEALRARIQSAIDDFNSGRRRAVLDLFDDDFVDSSGRTRIDKDALRTLLRGAFHGGGPGAPAYHVTLDGEQRIAVDLDTGAAALDLRLSLGRVPRGSRYLEELQPVWTVDVLAHARRGDDREWRLVDGTHRTVAGAPPAGF